MILNFVKKFLESDRHPSVDKWRQLKKHY